MSLALADLLLTSLQQGRHPRRSSQDAHSATLHFRRKLEVLRCKVGSARTARDILISVCNLQGANSRHFQALARLALAQKELARSKIHAQSRHIVKLRDDAADFLLDEGASDSDGLADWDSLYDQSTVGDEYNDAMDLDS